jgi:hypothetical protein
VVGRLGTLPPERPLFLIGIGLEPSIRAIITISSATLNMLLFHELNFQIWERRKGYRVS